MDYLRDAGEGAIGVGVEVFHRPQGKGCVTRINVPEHSACFAQEDEHDD